MTAGHMHGGGTLLDLTNTHTHTHTHRKVHDTQMHTRTHTLPVMHFLHIYILVQVEHRHTGTREHQGEREADW